MNRAAIEFVHMFGSVLALALRRAGFEPVLHPMRGRLDGRHRAADFMNALHDVQATAGLQNANDFVAECVQVLEMIHR